MKKNLRKKMGGVWERRLNRERERESREETTRIQNDTIRTNSEKVTVVALKEIDTNEKKTMVALKES